MRSACVADSQAAVSGPTPAAQREGGALPSALQTVTSPPWLAATCLTIDRPEPGATGVPGAGRVDPVEALEDAVALGRRDAEPWSVTLSSTSRLAGARADDDHGARPAV